MRRRGDARTRARILGVASARRAHGRDRSADRPRACARLHHVTRPRDSQSGHVPKWNASAAKRDAIRALNTFLVNDLPLAFLKFTVCYYRTRDQPCGRGSNSSQDSAAFEADKTCETG